MPRAKTPRTNGKSKTVTAIPEASVSALPELTATAEVRKHNPPIPINLEEEIRRRAYELYQQRGCTPGRDHEDWLVAEREVLARYQQQSA